MSGQKPKDESPQELYASMLPAYADVARRTAKPCALRFKNPHRIKSVADIRSDIEREQLTEACGHYDGEYVPLERRFSTEPPDLELSFANMLEVWDVEREGRLAYKAFIYKGDSGSIFVHHAFECISEINQCHIQSQLQAYEPLAEELRQALAWLPHNYPSQEWQLRGMQ